MLLGPTVLRQTQTHFSLVEAGPVADAAFKCFDAHFWCDYVAQSVKACVGLLRASVLLTAVLTCLPKAKMKHVLL